MNSKCATVMNKYAAATFSFLMKANNFVYFDSGSLYFLLYAKSRDKVIVQNVTEPISVKISSSEKIDIFLN